MLRRSLLCLFAPLLLAFFGVFVQQNSTACSSDDSLRVVATSEETDTPLPNLTVEVQRLDSDVKIIRTTDVEGSVTLPVERGMHFRLTVAGIDIRSRGDESHMIPSVGTIRPIEISLSKKEIREAAESLRARMNRDTELNNLRAKVDRAEVFKMVRSFLDTILDKQVLSDEKIEFTAVKNNRKVVLTSDIEGMVYFHGHQLDLASGDEFLIRSLNPETKKEQYTGEGPNGGFVYSDERLPADWQGGFKYLALPVRSARLMGVTFEPNSSLLKKSRELDDDLECLAAMMKRIGYTIEMQGHTDNSTTLKDSIQAVQANVELSEKRANALRDYFVAKFQVSPQSVKAVGYGQEFPIADNNTEAGRAKNRRVVIKVRNRTRQ